MISIRSDMTVDLVQHVGNDQSILAAMMVSTKASESREMFDTEASYGKINFLMSQRHGSPFEHSSMTFLIEAPIFVYREWHRHRVGWSYNEESGRYKQLDPVFYVPNSDRALVQEGKAGHYVYVKGENEQYERLVDRMKDHYEKAYSVYENNLQDGVAREVARIVLPVGTYSSMYATCNPRSLMSFLSLRTKDENSKFPSYPQREIEMCAEKMEYHFSKLFPLTHRAFQENGRVAP